MATLTVVAINNKTLTDSKGAVTTLVKQFNYDQVVFGPVAFVPANHTPHTATGLAYFTYDEGLARPTKYVVSDSLATTRAYFLAAGTLKTTAVPTSYLLPSMGVGVYGTPVVETATADNIAFTVNMSTATNKTVEDSSSTAAYIGISNTTDTINNKMQGLLVSNTINGDLFDAYAVQGHTTITHAMTTKNANAHITGLSGKVLLSAAVEQGWVTGVLGIIDGASEVTGLCHVGALVAEVGVTTLDAMLYVDNGGNACYGIQFVGTMSTGILMSACTTGISLAGACTTGVLVGGATTTAISITGNATTAIEVKTGTVVTGISLAACTTGVALTGAMTTGIAITGATTNAVSITGNATSALLITTGTFTNAISIGAATGVTNLIKFNAVAGCVVAKDVVPSATPSALLLGATNSIKVDIGGTAYYIPLFATLHA